MLFTYTANLIKVIDANTIDAEIDLGFGVFVRQRIRLYGISVLSESTNQLYEAKARLAELIGNEFIVKTVLNKRGKFGRVLGIIYPMDDQTTSINDMLVAEGKAIEYQGGLK